MREETFQGKPREMRNVESVDCLWRAARSSKEQAQGRAHVDCSQPVQRQSCSDPCSTDWTGRCRIECFPCWVRGFVFLLLFVMGLVLPHHAYIPHLGIGILMLGYFIWKYITCAWFYICQLYRWEFVMSLRSNSGLELLSRV